MKCTLFLRLRQLFDPSHLFANGRIFIEARKDADCYLSVNRYKSTIMKMLSFQPISCVVILGTVALATTASQPADASTAADCIGTVDQFAVQSNGILEVDGSWNNSTSVLNLCYVDKNYTRNNGTIITPATCQAWAKLLMGAHLSGRTIKLNEAEAGCSTGSWSSPAIVRIY